MVLLELVVINHLLLRKKKFKSDSYCDIEKSHVSVLPRKVTKQT